MDRDGTDYITAHRPLRCAVLVERRYLAQAQPRGLIDCFRSLGHEVLVVDPESLALEAGDSSWLDGVDLAVARGRSWAVLTMLGWAEASNIPTINRRWAVAAVHNKADMALRMRAAGLPVPLTYFGSTAQLAGRFRPSDYPVILKPVFGDNGHGLQIVADEKELRATAWPEPIALAQPYIENDGRDLKLYCIGRELWAVYKPSPFADLTRKARPVPVKPAWRDLARRCGELFGLELFGVDCIETASGPLIIEVNEFPNYSGIPGASDKLAAYLLGRAQKEIAQ